MNALSSIRTHFANRRVTNFQETRASGDEEKFACVALERGAQTIVAVGGDGTSTRIANAILRSGKPCQLAVVPAGSGNDFAKTLGVLDLGITELADLVHIGDGRRIDVGRADGIYFLNSCGFGFDASVLEATSRVRFLKGNAVYMYSALAQLFNYRGVDVAIDDGRASRLLMVTVSNGRFLGGAFRIAPMASVLDGKLDVAYFDDCNVLQRLRVFAGAMRGTHTRLSSVRTEARNKLTLEFSEPPAMEIDGELRRARTSTVTIECVPRALSVIAAPGALT